MYKVTFISNMNPEINYEREEYTRNYETKEAALAVFTDLFYVGITVIIDDLKHILEDFSDNEKMHQIFENVIEHVSEATPDQRIDLQNNDKSFFKITEGYLKYDLYDSLFFLTLEETINKKWS